MANFTAISNITQNVSVSWLGGGSLSASSGVLTISNITSVAFASPLSQLDLGLVTVDGNYPDHLKFSGGNRYSLSSSRAIFSNGGFNNIPDYSGSFGYNASLVSGDVNFGLTFETSFQSVSGRTTEHYYDWAGVVPPGGGAGPGAKRIFQYNTSWGSDYGGVGVDVTPGYTHLTFVVEDFGVDSSGVGSTNGFRLLTATSPKSMSWTGISSWGDTMTIGKAGTALSIPSGSISLGGALIFIDGGQLGTTAGSVELAGGAGNMTIVAGTGNSRTVTIRTTKSDGTDTISTVFNADQSVTFSAAVSASSSTTGTVKVQGGVGVTGSVYASSLRTTGSTGFIQYTSGVDIFSIGSDGSDTYLAMDQNANGNMIFRLNSSTEVLRLVGTTNLVQTANNFKVSGTTEATTGAAGSVITLGGIYSTKKIITASTFTSAAGITWDLGAAAVVSPTSPNRTLKVTVAGTDYYIAAKTTND